MSKTDAPERIWIKQVGPPVGGYVGEAWGEPLREQEVGYIRIDLDELEILQQEIARLRAELEEARGNTLMAIDDARRSHNLVAAFQRDAAEMRLLLRKATRIVESDTALGKA